MAVTIIISHYSETIRSGLKCILENEVQAAIHCFKDLDDLQKNLIDTYSQIILIVPVDTSKSALNTILKDSRNLAITGGIDISGNSSLNQSFDFIFKIDDSAKSLVKHIKSYISDKEHSPAEDELTSREKDVLRLIALGQTNKEIAENLYISAHTVISHRKNITEKLGIKSIPGLTVYALIKKIISQSDIAKTS